MPNRFACLSLFAWAVVCLACAGVSTSTKPPTKTPDGAKDVVPKSKDEKPDESPQKKDKSSGGKPIRDPLDAPETAYKFGEAVRSGDLIVTVTHAQTTTCGGQYHGRYRAVVMMTVWLTVENTHKGRIIDWDGWQNTALAEDEHGNQFKRCDLDGWAWLPGNLPAPNEWNGDFKTRIAPGITYRNILYFEPAPVTSKQMTITVPLDGKMVRFRGPMDDPDPAGTAQRKQKEALDAKKGIVLDAVAFFADAVKGSKMLDTEYPRGCTMRVTGVLLQKSDSTLNHTDMVFMLRCELPKPSTGNVTVWCRHLDDMDLYEKAKVGDKVTLQGLVVIAGIDRGRDGQQSVPALQIDHAVGVK